ncbi:hypothetical protein [Bradyrhizobium sp. AZCC 2230]|uniref:hypothetical protein n=1 Tax=Bradyrhizobium sp. AZCC 2230 TaxID=3117021 RepID=UPI002FF3848C
MQQFEAAQDIDKQGLENDIQSRERISLATQLWPAGHADWRAPRSTPSISPGLLDRDIRIPPAVEPTFSTVALELFAIVLKGGVSLVLIRSAVRSITVPETTVSSKTSSACAAYTRSLGANQTAKEVRHVEAAIEIFSRCRCEHGYPTAWWKTLGSPVLTPDVQKTLIDSVHVEVGSRSIDELAAERDGVLLGSLELRNRVAKSSQTKVTTIVA